MLRRLALLLILLLGFQGPQTLSQTKCKGLGKGPGRAGGGGRGSNSVNALPVIKIRPQPKYTKEALRRNVQGYVTLLVLFHSSGQVRDICVIQGLPYGLTKRAVDAAYRIKFEPAVKEGQPVSVPMAVTYEFSTY